MSPLKTFFPLLLLATIAILAAHASVVHAENQTQLAFTSRDNDVADTHLVDITPGVESRFKLEYKVQLSSWEGDDELKDGELAFDANGHSIRIWVGLGNDNVVLRVYEDNNVKYEKEIAHQDGWRRQDISGRVDIRIKRECSGLIKVYYGDRQIYSIGSNPTRAIAVYGDNDAIHEYDAKIASCDVQSEDAVKTGNTKFMVAAGAAAAGLGLAAVAARFLT